MILLCLHFHDNGLLMQILVSYMTNSTRSSKHFTFFMSVIYEFPAAPLLRVFRLLAKMSCQKPAWLESQPLFGILIYKRVPLYANQPRSGSSKITSMPP